MPGQPLGITVGVLDNVEEVDGDPPSNAEYSVISEAEEEEDATGMMLEVRLVVVVTVVTPSSTVAV